MTRPASPQARPNRYPAPAPCASTRRPPIEAPTAVPVAAAVVSHDMPSVRCPASTTRSAMVYELISVAEMPSPATKIATAIAASPGMNASGPTPSAVAASPARSRELCGARQRRAPYHRPAIALPRP